MDIRDSPVRLDGRTIFVTVTANPSTVTDWILHIDNFYGSHHYQNPAIVGLNLTRPPHRTPRSGVTLHLFAGGHYCLILQLIRIPYYPGSLLNFLANPRYLFAGYDIHLDVTTLSVEWGLYFSRVYDTLGIAMQRRPYLFPYRPTFSILADTVAGIEVPDDINLIGDWIAISLSPDLITSAVNHAYANWTVAVILFRGLGWSL